MTLDDVLATELADWPEGAAVVVVRPGGVVARHGSRAAREWASVTKLLAALAVLVEVDRGSLDLDAATGPPGSTLRHLLAHTSGLAFGDEQVVEQPGRRRVYSSAGYDVVARHVEARLGRDVPTLLSTTLGSMLDRTTIDPGRRAATGARGTIDDLAVLALELVAPRDVPREVVARASTTAFPGLAGEVPGWGVHRVSDWGLGPEVRGVASHWMPEVLSPATFGHFGQAGSFLWVDPEREVGLGGLSPRPFGAWSKRVWPRLARRVVGVLDEERDRR